MTSRWNLPGHEYHGKVPVRTLASAADLGAIGAADRVVLEAEERRNMATYVEALRELCRVARAEAMREREGAA